MLLRFRLQEKQLKPFAGLLIFLLPASSLVVENVGSAPFALLVLLACLSLPLLPGKQELHKYEVILLLTCTAFFVWAIISMYLVGPDHDALSRVAVYSRFFTFIPVYYLIRRVQPSVYWLVSGLVAGSILTGLYAIAEIWFGLENSYPGRASGVRHPVYFGDFSLLMACMSLAYLKMVPGWNFRLVIVVAALLGLLASMLSGTRGAWAALPVMLVILMWQYWPIVKPAYRKFLLIVMVVIPIILFYLPVLNVSDRFAEAVEDVRKYEQGVSLGTSVGMRLEMWRAALEMSSSNVLSGVGVGGYEKNVRSLVSNKGFDASIQAFGNPHNEYLNVLATRGLIGLVLLMLVFIVPVMGFLRYKGSAIPEVRSCSFAGIMHVASFSIFSISAAPFERALPISFYIFFVYILTAMIVARQNRVDNCERA